MLIDHDYNNETREDKNHIIKFSGNLLDSEPESNSFL